MPKRSRRSRAPGLRLGGGIAGLILAFAITERPRPVGRGPHRHRRRAGRRPDRPPALRAVRRVHVRRRQGRVVRRACCATAASRRRANNIGLSRHWERHPDDRIDDYGLSFGWDAEVAYPVSLDFFEEKPVQHSLRVDLTDGIVERHGVYQPRIPVRAGIAYHGYLWLKTTGYDGRIRVALEEDRSGGARLCRGRDQGAFEGDWKRYPFVLHPPNGPTPTPGWRSSSKEAAGACGSTRCRSCRGTPWAASGPTSRRSWRRCDRRSSAGPAATSRRTTTGRGASGPRDRRPIWTNLSWKNEPEPGDIGTDEFIAFCRRVGAEPSITVNVEGRGATAEEAAAWVEYCNGPATSRYGAMRAANGHPEPYRRQVLGARQRDLGRLGARPLRRPDLRAQLPAVPPGHARRGPQPSSSSRSATTTWAGTGREPRRQRHLGWRIRAPPPPHTAPEDDEDASDALSPRIAAPNTGPITSPNDAGGRASSAASTANVQRTSASSPSGSITQSSASAANAGPVVSSTRYAHRCGGSHASIVSRYSHSPIRTNRVAPTPCGGGALVAAFVDSGKPAPRRRVGADRGKDRIHRCVHRLDELEPDRRMCEKIERNRSHAMH